MPAPLSFAPRPASTGDPAAVLGYPEDGPLDVRSARVRARATVSGADIYGNSGVSREVYSIRSLVRSGNSGGPLLAADGTVLGVVFATDLRTVGHRLRPDRRRGRRATSRPDARRYRGRWVPAGCTPG